ncbi:MAG: asparagine synthase (glutamine-hydrolyzing) [Gemmatimonadota bacterium]
MCGIAGKVLAAPDGAVDRSLVARMCDRLRHRGPDDEGLRVQGRVGIGMRRLEVIDLEGGHQPMANEDGSLWIVFNGEIYNYRLLRQELEAKGHRFASQSDTEVILHLYEDLGAECVERLRGMFAFALWDSVRDQLFLARDRLGKKPLFYADLGHGLTFASELGAMLCDPEVDAELDYRAVDEYLTYLFVPHPRTIYRRVRKLPPGSRAVYRAGRLEVERYWTVEYRPASAAGGYREAEDELEALLLEAVELRLAADVPLGAFLSGGLDSSLIVALMRRLRADVQTFSVGFQDASFDELGNARRAAAALGTRHREFRVSYGVRELMPDLLEHFGEPFADASAIPTYHLSRVTREHVTVALSGDGGDEVFGGYRRYIAGLWAGVYNFPAWRAPVWGMEQLAGRLREPAGYYGASWRKKIRRFAEFARRRRELPGSSWDFFLTEADKQRLYTGHFAAVLAADADPASLAPYQASQSQAGDQSSAWLDLMTYLPDDILTKVDRMSMATSLEVRCPLLDHVVVEHMARMPRHEKFGYLSGKRLLRRMAARHLPAEILQRPKHGFAVPMARWLKAELRPWMEELLLSSASRSRALFEPSVVGQMVDLHLSGRRDLSQQLWALMVLELWLSTHAVAP